jgi:hypothetical protein
MAGSNILERGGAFHGLLGGQVAEDADHARHERVRSYSWGTQGVRSMLGRVRPGDGTSGRGSVSRPEVLEIPTGS